MAATAAAAGLPLFGDVPAARAEGTSPAAELLFVGSWKGTQIYGAWFDSVRGTLTATGPLGDAASNWATTHPARPVLYVGSGNDGGTVYSFSIDRATGALTQTGAVNTDAGGTAGGGIGILTVDRPSGTLLVANYEAGLTATLPIAADGGLGSPVSVVRDAGSGPNARQAAPHAHDVVIDPGGTLALVTDFGADRVFIYPFNRATRVLSAEGAPGPGYFAVTPGSGPRRLVFHPNGRIAYLMTELTANLLTLRWDAKAGTLTQLQSLSTDSAGFTGTPSGAELAVSGDGRFVYASNRGENTLLVYSADKRTGLLTLVQRTSPGGNSPWSFSIHPSGRWLLVANLLSDTVNLFSIDPRSGTVTDTSVSAAIPSPDCVTFFA